MSWQFDYYQTFLVGPLVGAAIFTAVIVACEYFGRQS